MSFPIIGWVRLPEELTREDVFANIERSGVNVFMTCSDSPEAIRKQMDLAAEHDLQALVVDPRFSAADKPGWEDRARAAVAEYAACFGFFVRDEPGRGEFEREGRSCPPSCAPSGRTGSPTSTGSASVAVGLTASWSTSRNTPASSSRSF